MFLKNLGKNGLPKAREVLQNISKVHEKHDLKSMKIRAKTPTGEKRGFAPFRGT